MTRRRVRPSRRRSGRACGCRAARHRRAGPPRPQRRRGRRGDGPPPGRRALRPRAGRRPRHRLPLVERDPGVARAAEGRAAPPADDRRRLRRRRPPRPRRRPGVVDPLPGHVVAVGARVAARGGGPSHHGHPGRHPRPPRPRPARRRVGPPTSSSSTPTPRRGHVPGGARPVHRRPALPGRPDGGRRHHRQRCGGGRGGRAHRRSPRASWCGRHEGDPRPRQRCSTRCASWRARSAPSWWPSPEAPAMPSTGRGSGPLESWRSVGGGRARRCGGSSWRRGPTPRRRRPLVEIDLDAWVVRSELALARWVAALGVAKVRCADGGAIVAVVDRPAPLDCAGWAPESGIADAVEALIRSLARVEGPRGVRVNAVTTPARLTRRPVVDPPPPLAGFPGRSAPRRARRGPAAPVPRCRGPHRHGAARRLRAVVVTDGTIGTGDPKVVLVTGASGGVGRGIAIACGQAGWTVWIAARREAQAAAVAAEVDAAGGHGRAVVCDVADPDSVRGHRDAVVDARRSPRRGGPQRDQRPLAPPHRPGRRARRRRRRPRRRLAARHLPARRRLPTRT